MKEQEMTEYLKKIDTNTSGNRNDVTTLFADHDSFMNLVDDLVLQFNDIKIDFVACIDALGFILGTAIAIKIKAGIVTIRKGGKLPVQSLQEEFIDYSGTNKILELREDLLSKNSNVLIVDEWIETGAQISASIKLLKSIGSNIVGIATINYDKNETTENINEVYGIYKVWKE